MHYVHKIGSSSQQRALDPEGKFTLHLLRCDPLLSIVIELQLQLEGGGKALHQGVVSAAARRRRCDRLGAGLPGSRPRWASCAPGGSTKTKAAPSLSSSRPAKARNTHRTVPLPFTVCQH